MPYPGPVERLHRPSRPSSTHRGGWTRKLALLAVLREVLSPQAVHLHHPFGVRNRLAMRGLTRLVDHWEHTQAVVEEPYACRANCRLRRSLVALTVHSRSGGSFIAEKPSSGLTRRRHVRASGLRGGYTAGRTGSAESGAERAQTVTQMAGATAAAVGRMGAGRGVVERAGHRAEAADIARCETTHGPH